MAQAPTSAKRLALATLLVGTFSRVSLGAALAAHQVASVSPRVSEQRTPYLLVTVDRGPNEIKHRQIRLLRGRFRYIGGQSIRATVSAGRRDRLRRIGTGGLFLGCRVRESGCDRTLIRWPFVTGTEPKSRLWLELLVEGGKTVGRISESSRIPSSQRADHVGTSRMLSKTARIAISKGLGSDSAPTERVHGRYLVWHEGAELHVGSRIEGTSSYKFVLRNGIRGSARLVVPGAEETSSSARKPPLSAK
jgi:hypothetical protein